jgi:hypothetical protein
MESARFDDPIVSLREKVPQMQMSESTTMLGKDRVQNGNINTNVGKLLQESQDCDLSDNTSHAKGSHKFTITGIQLDILANDQSSKRRYQNSLDHKES